MRGGDKRAVAIADFTADQDGDLGFTHGDKIMVTDDSEEWWVGYREAEPDVKGSFPSNYVAERGGGGKRVMAIEDFAPIKHGDLGFTRGDEIMVTDDSQEWWVGYRSAEPNVIGSFPSNYVAPPLQAWQTVGRS